MLNVFVLNSKQYKETISYTYLYDYYDVFFIRKHVIYIVWNLKCSFNYVPNIFTFIFIVISNISNI